jgi:ribonuclease J
MLFRESMTADLDRMENLRDTRLIYSMWPGYLECGTKDLNAWCRRNHISLTIRHTSGHADPVLLQRFAKAFAPEQLVPIHTAVPHEYIQHFDNVKISANGE